MFEQQRSFEGRTLPHPGEDLEDQGLTFDVGTVLSRRKVLGLLGIGAGGMALAACAPGGSSAASSTVSAASTTASTTPAADLTEMNSETEGPYPGDGSNGPDVLEQAGVERSDIRSSIDSDTTAEGVPISLTMNIIDMANNNASMVGAAVYIWHCDAPGRYSMYDAELSDETYLRGVQVTDKYGQVTFESIFPGCYQGRWPHIHFEVFPDKTSIADAGNNVLTSQIALDEAASREVYTRSEYGNSLSNLNGISLDSDGIFSDGHEQQLAKITGDVSKGFTLSIDVAINTNTEQQTSMGGAPGGSGGPGAPGMPGEMPSGMPMPPR